MNLFRKLNDNEYEPIDGLDLLYVFPEDGTWIVETDEHGIRHCSRLGEKPYMYPFANVERYRNIIENALVHETENKLSVVERASLIIDMISKRLIEEKENRNLDKLDFL